MATKKKQPEVIVPLTYEQQYEKALAAHAEKQAWDPQFLTEPTFKLAPGDSVILGHLKDCRIESLIDDAGMWYYMSYQNSGLHYGIPFDHGRATRVVPWIDLVPKNGVCQTKFATPFNQDNWSIQDIDAMLQRSYNDGFVVDPDYQRGYVWTPADKHQLIHSVMNRFDIGKFVYIKYDYNPGRRYTYEILDGKQRMNALQEFVEGRFEYEGYTFIQFSDDDRRALLGGRVQYVDVSASRLTEAMKLHLFLSVNTAGVPQSAEHMDKVRAMYEKAIRKEADGKQS